MVETKSDKKVSARFIDESQIKISLSFFILYPDLSMDFEIVNAKLVVKSNFRFHRFLKVNLSLSRK